MRRHGLVIACTLGVAALAVAVASAVASAHSTPRIRAEQTQQRAVLKEVSRIGAKLQAFEDQGQNAQQRLVLVRQNMTANKYRLRVAKRSLGTEQKRLMARLYALYVNRSPSALEVISGAHSLSQLIDRLDAAQALSSQDAAIASQALRFERSVTARERRLLNLERERAQTIGEIDAKKRMAASELAHQKRLLATIHTTIARLQAREAARERAARAAAEARLREEIAARKAARRAAKAKAQRAAQARAKRAAQAKAKRADRTRARQAAPVSRPHHTRQIPRSHHSRRSHHSSSPPKPPPPPTLTPPPPPPPNLPVRTGAGHPAAAQIALRYLGVPYLWGGASPAGFDCSGLVMYVYDQLGISLPHYTVAQWDDTKPISSPAPGDLVFFNGRGHVGIYLGGGQFVDAPHTGSVVRIDNIAGFGSYDGARRVP